MAKYYVTLPIAGSIVTYVEADSPEDAIDKAVGPDHEITEDELNQAEWEYMRQIVKGNVCYASPSTAEAELDDDD